MLCGQILQFPPHGGRSQIEAILPSESQLGGGEPQGTQRAVDLLRVTLRSAGFSLKNREVRLLGNVWVFTDSGHSR